MKRFNDFKISIRLNMCLGGALIIIITGIGYYIIQNSKASIFADVSQSMQEQVLDMKYMIDIQITSNQKIVNISLALAHDYFYGLGSVVESPENPIKFRAINQISQEEKDVYLNTWTVNGQVMQNSTEVVDKIHEKSVETATIFQKIPEGYLRISTNVRNADSTRAVGTFIPNNSPVIKAIERGEIYRGRAYVVNDWYLTAYEPIFINGEVKGILYVGLREKNMAEIRKIFNQKIFLTSGYPYLVDQAGTLIVHPNREGDNIVDTPYFKQMLAQQNDKIHRIEFESENQKHYLYFTYFEPIKSYIVAKINDKDMDLAKQRNAILYGLTVGIGLFITIIIILTRNIKHSIDKGVSLANHLAHGNLSHTIDINQKDEIGVLANSLNSMVLKLRNVIGAINESVLDVHTGSEQISESSQQIAMGANEQAATSEQISVTIEEMILAITQTTENAQKAELIAIRAEHGIQKAETATNNTLKIMQNIAEKISIVSEIASKTDLLAVNAAIEASKAGQYGKGFAVVAHEIRKLAENTKNAARTITDLTKTSVIMAQNAKNLLCEVAPDVNNTALLVQDISVASVEQNQNAIQIGKAVQQFNIVVQQNSSSAEELSTGAEELSAQSQNLKHAISFFTLHEHNLDDTATKTKILKQLLATINNNTEINIDNYDISLTPKQAVQTPHHTSGINLQMNDNESHNTPDNDFKPY